MPVDTDTPLTVTDSAAARVRQLIDGEGDPDLMLRVGVRPGGCSGFAYEMFLDTEHHDSDTTFTVPVADGDPFTVVVDATSAQLLAGATLDHHDTLERSGFKVTNPNAHRTCGCGQSFS